MKEHGADALEVELGADGRTQYSHANAQAASIRRALSDRTAILVKKAQAGDLDAFEQLCREKYEWAFSHAKKILRDYHDAEDATQDAFINVYRKLGELKASEAFDRWLYQILRRECFRVIPRRNRAAYDRNLDDYVDELPETDEDLSPAHSTEKQEQSTFLRSIVDDLPPRRRKVVEMSYYEDKSNVAIANELSISQSTVASTLTRARNEIRERIESNVSGTAIYNYGAIAAIMDAVKSESALPAIPAVSAFIPAVKTFVAECMAGAGKLAAIFSTGAAKVVCIGILTVSTVTAAVVVPPLIDTAEDNKPDVPVVTQSAPTAPQDPVVVQSKPNAPAQSVISGDDINPARIALNSGETVLDDVRWRIVSAGTDAEIYSGVGSEVTEPLRELLANRADGDYELEFLYTHGDDTNTVTYTFHIVSTPMP
jgi:RNA polymerase sigma-70 factor (ECF subfamily)